MISEDHIPLIRGGSMRIPEVIHIVAGLEGLRNYWVDTDGLEWPSGHKGWVLKKTVRVFDEPQTANVYIAMSAFERQKDDIERIVTDKTRQAVQTMRRAVHNRQKYII